MPDHSSSTTNDRVVSIRSGRRYQPAAGSAKDPAPSGDLDQYEKSGEPDDFRHRMTVNAIAFLFVAGLVIAGVWLADTITTMRKTQDCVLSGKRGCAQIETPVPVR
jgi:hypothetical protein